jgi:hypothetical protein
MQSRLQVFHAVVAHVQQVVPSLRITQARGISLLVLGAIWAEQVALRKMAAALPLSAHPASTERRLRRWISSDRLPTTVVWSTLRRTMLADAAQPEVLVVFDLTPLRGQYHLLCLGLVHGRRALPLAWRLQPLHTPWEQPLAAVLAELIAQVHADLPSDRPVTLLADRGLVGPGVVDACTNAGWQVVLRLKAGDRSRVRHPDGAEEALAALVARVPRRWTGAVDVFKKAGWRSGYLTVYQGAGNAEPWVLFSTHAAGLARVRDYRKRMRIEATFQDLKGRGFHLDRSRLGTSERIERLCLIVSLALWWLHGLGDVAVKHGKRACWDRPDCPTFSRLRLGWCYLQWCERHQRVPPLPFRTRTTQRTPWPAA